LELHIERKERDPQALWSETNFVEYPYFKLGKRNSKEQEIKIEIDLPQGTALWHVTNPEGLPGILSYEVFTALELELEKNGLSSDGALYFSIGDILSTLNWKSRGGADYKAIRDAIDKIVDTKISANQTLTDGEKKTKESYKNFRLLTEFQMTKLEYPDGTHQDISSVRFNSTYVNNRKHGYVSPISVNTFFAKLKSPVAKRLYQYLNKRAFFMAKRGDLFSISVIELGTLMGLKAKYVSDINKTMSKAHTELIDIGFLKSVDMVKERGRSKVYKYLFSEIFQKQETAERKQVSFSSSVDSEVSQQLLSYGIKRDRVEVMINESLPQLKIVLRHLASEKKRGKVVKNPAGFIYSFLKNEWSIPDSKEVSVTVHKKGAVLPTTAEERGYVRDIPTMDTISNYVETLSTIQRRELYRDTLITIGELRDSVSDELLESPDIFEDQGPLNNPFLCSRARMALVSIVGKRLEKNVE